MTRAMRWTAMRPDELPDVVEVHPLSAPGEPVTYVREDDETVEAFKLALEIVRCRDCKHLIVSPLGAAMYCERFESLWLDGRTDGFCYWGEAR